VPQAARNHSLKSFGVEIVRLLLGNVQSARFKVRNPGAVLLKKHVETKGGKTAHNRHRRILLVFEIKPLCYEEEVNDKRDDNEKENRIFK